MPLGCRKMCVAMYYFQRRICPLAGVIFLYMERWHVHESPCIEIMYNCRVNRVLFTMYSCIPTDMLYCIIDTVVSKT